MRRFIPAILFLLAASVAFGQKFTAAIYYDRVTGLCYRQRLDGTFQAFTHLPSVSHGVPVQLHVINVNTFKYSVRVTAKSEVLFQQMPSVFSASSFLPKVAVPAYQSTVALLSARSKSGAGGDAYADLKSRVDMLKGQLDSFNGQLSELDDLSQLDTRIARMAASGPDPELVPNTKDPRDPGLKAAEEVRAKVRAYVAQLLQEDADGNGQGFSKSAQVKAGAPPASQDLGTLADSKISHLKDTFSDIKQEYDSLRDKLAQAQPAESRSAGVGSTPQAIMPDDDDVKVYKLLSGQLEDTYTQVQKKIWQIDYEAPNRSEHLAAASDLYQEIMSSNFYEADGPMSTPQGDVLLYTIEIFDPVPHVAPIATTSNQRALALNQAKSGEIDKSGAASTTAAKPKKKPSALGAGGGNEQSPQSGDAALGTAEKTINIPVYVTGRTKLDFSTGLLVSSLTDGNYYAAPTSGGKFIIKAGPSDRLSASLGALLHLYITSTSDVIPAFSVGVSQIGTSSLQYFVGGSLLMGHDQRFVLTAGLAGRDVNRLSGMSVGEITSTAAITTAAVFRIGYFIGLTFNLR